jgi:hypothetical protein
MINININNGKQLIYVFVGLLVIGVIVGIFISLRGGGTNQSHEEQNYILTEDQEVVLGTKDYVLAYNRRKDNYVVSYIEGDVDPQILIEKIAEEYEEEFGESLDQTKLFLDIPGAVYVPEEKLYTREDYENQESGRGTDF